MAVEWFVDKISGAPLPILIVQGWCTDPANVDVRLRYGDGRIVAPSLLCREPREDVVAVKGVAFPWPGFIAEFHLDGAPKAVIVFGEEITVEQPERYCAAQPHYGDLYQTTQVLHRDSIYGSGLPLEANPVVMQLTAALLGSRILDFGCGSGDLVAKMRAQGRDVTGIEIDRPAIREHLRPGAAPFVKLYDGSLPLPYADRSFDSVLATEVIEHVDKPEAVTQELMRVCRETIFITVPDMSSIPFSWPTATVPWHLLEVTHVNFFNARSLCTLFAPQFMPAKYFRIGNNVIREHFIPGSICVLFERRSA